MLSFQEFNIQILTNYLIVHPNLASFFTYLIVFIESMAVIGVIIPGAITMPLIGFLIGSAIIPLGNTMLWAVLGAFTGDCLSFWIGRYFKWGIHKIWPFTKWPNLLTRSEKFFHDHGGKSVFIGRFVGPTRAMIPMVAGMLKMSYLRFILAAIPSAVIWAFGYMLPGILLGALSLELPPKIAAQFTLWGLGVIVVLWLIAWVSHHFFRQIYQAFDNFIQLCWKSCKKYPKLKKIEKLLSDPKEPDNHLQLTLLVMMFVSGLIFLFVLYQVLTGGFLVTISHPVYYLLTSLRIQMLDRFFVLLTLLANIKVLLLSSGIIFFWLMSKRNVYIATHWLAMVILAFGSTAFMKLFIYSPRPGGVLYDIHSSSFPSAHVALAMALYGFLAVIIARELKGVKRKLTYAVVGFLVGIIAFSRMYLGAHWLVDVIGSFFLSLTILLMLTISYRRRHVLHFRVKEFILVVVGAFTVVLFLYTAAGFKQRFDKYVLNWPHQVVTKSELIKDSNPQLPLYRLNRLGFPVEPFNVVYIGDLKILKENLLKKGWVTREEKLELPDMIKNYSTNLSIFPQLYHNNKVALLLIKRLDNKGDIAVLHLWESDIDLKESDDPLWIGTIEYRNGISNPFSVSRFRAKRRFIGATDFLTSQFGKKFRWWLKYYPLNTQPEEMRYLNWDGKFVVVLAR